VLRTQGAWLPDDQGDLAPPAWLTFDWPAAGGSWSLTGDDEEAKTAIEAYFRQATPMHRADDLSEEEVARLRALGYVGE
jgi:hypothetical protein